VTILDIYHHASLGRRAGEVSRLTSPMAAKTPRISRRLAVPHAILCQAAGFVVARALSWIASTAAKAVMFRMPRTLRSASGCGPAYRLPTESGRP
jgi:hypothetical protein